MYRCTCHDLYLVIICYFHIRGAVIAVRPFQANTPLRVYSDTILTPAITLKDLKTVVPRGSQVLDARRSVQNLKTLLSLFGETLKFLYPLAFGKPLSQFVPSVLYHA